MTDKIYTVEVISQPDADAILRRMKNDPANPGGYRTVRLPGGLEISGDFSITARDTKSGEIAWEHSDKNLITDYGRRRWMEQKWGGALVTIGFAPSIETPQLGRYSIASDSTQCVESAAISPVLTGGHTKVLSTTFVAPAVNRTLGMIAIMNSQNAGFVSNRGLEFIMAFALLTPSKTQTTTQTLEVTYRVSMNPIA